MNEEIRYRYFNDYAWITAFALAVNLFVIPNDLGEGGVTGLTIIAYYLFGWSPSIVSFVMNAALLIVGYKF